MKIDFKDCNFNDLHTNTDFECEVKNFLKEWISSSETVDVATSGSTGTPKKLKIEKEKMRNSAKMTCDFFDFKEGDSALLCLPVAYVSGKMMVVRALERKMVLKIADSSTKPLIHLIEKIDFCAMTPLQVENSLDKIHFIKNLIIGGAQVSENLKQKIANTLKDKNADCHIFETYGMSETLSHIALKEIYPNENEYFSILNDIEISTDDRNCLKIEAPKLNSEILQTNDIVDLIDKQHFQFLGRADFVINSGGAKIFPEELENLLKSKLLTFGIENELVFIGKKDEVLGQKLVLIIEGNFNENIIQKVNSIAFEKKFHKPKEIQFIQKFPRTENGKILRREILKLKVISKK